jgi:hypothetical protein
MSECLSVDTFSERNPTVTLRKGDYIVELLSVSAEAYKTAHLHAVRLLASDPTLSWAVDLLAPRAKSLLGK